MGHARHVSNAAGAGSGRACPATSLALTLLASAFVLGGCAGPAPQSAPATPTTVAASTPSPDAADDDPLLRAMAAAAAAARMSVAERRALDFEAAAALLDAGSAALAAAVLAPHAVQDWPPLTAARLWAAQGADGDAAAALSAIVPGELTGADRARLHALEIELRTARDDVAGALAAGTALMSVEDAGVSAVPLARRLVALLAQPDSATLAALAADPTLADWARLAEAMRAPLATRQAALEAWRAARPTHPLASTDGWSAVEAAARPEPPPRVIALLLPSGGRFAEAAAGVRRGFVAAWYADGADPARPRVLFGDGGASAVTTTLASMVAAGADFIVGPLEKDAVETVLAGAGAGLPVLALNQRPADAGRRSAELTLLPEAEAERVAERAWFEGHLHPLLLVPATEWGERMADAHARRHAALGGGAVAIARYPEDIDDWGPFVAEALGIPESERRIESLRRALDIDLVAQPEPRRDVDSIYMPAWPRAARQLAPQLRYYGITGIPVYTSSHVHAGGTRADDELDLEGLAFPDLPWIVDALASSEAGVLGLAVDAAPTVRRLEALGVDAYRVARTLWRLRAEPGSTIEGASGRLTLGADGQVERTPVFATYRNGRPIAEERPGGSQPLDAQ